MEDFLNKLYSYEYFGTYLMISIVVLLLLFIIILFFGKKDQKHREIEATKKLQQINSENAFKEESQAQNVKVNAEAPITLEKPNLNDTIVVPNINDVPTINSETVTSTNEIPEPVLPSDTTNEVQAQNPNENVYKASGVTTPNVEIPSAPSIEPQPASTDIPTLEEPKANPEVSVASNPQVEVQNPTPVLAKEEEKPFVFSDSEFNAFVNDIPEESLKPTNFEPSGFTEPRMPEMPSSANVDESNVSVPSFNLDEIIEGVEETRKEQITPVTPEISKSPEVFSSVYAPKSEEPVIKEAPQEVAIPKDDDLDIELPTLKKNVEEEKPEEMEMPVLNDYNLDNLSGESYTINR